MTRTQAAFLWAAFIIVSAVSAVSLDLGGASAAILVTTLSAASVTSLRKSHSDCGS